MNKVSHDRFKQMLADRASEYRIPLHGTFELTPRCNLNCKMCYVHILEGPLQPQMISGEEWIALMDEAISTGMIYALLTGGEAVTHRDFWSIYDHLIQKGIRVQLKSNGVLLQGDILKRLQVQPPDAVDISLYGCDAESYRAVTGIDAFGRVMVSIRALQEAGIPFRIMVTPSRPMLPWLEQILRLAKSFGAPVRVNAILIPPRGDTNRTLEESGLTVQEYLEVERLSREILQTEPWALDEQIIGRAEEKKAPTGKGLTCAAGRTMFTMRWNGQMAPCPGFPEGVCEQDIRSLGFAEAWRRMNKEVEEYEIPDVCHTCDLADKCRYCPAVHGQSAGKHQCNEEYCRYKHNLE